MQTVCRNFTKILFGLLVCVKLFEISRYFLNLIFTNKCPQNPTTELHSSKFQENRDRTTRYIKIWLHLLTNAMPIFIIFADAQLLEDSKLYATQSCLICCITNQIINILYSSDLLCLCFSKQPYHYIRWWSLKIWRQIQAVKQIGEVVLLWSPLCAINFALQKPESRRVSTVMKGE